MNFFKKIRLIFSFYTYFIWVSLFIDIACGYLLWRNGTAIYSTLFWFKFFTMGASGYLVNEFRKEEYFYFFNFGLSKKTLWISTLTFDLFLFFACMILSYQLR